ncbi:hypothetical protein Micbo1qcDRAFT_199110, partial [Microdochium bolleyi]
MITPTRACATPRPSRNEHPPLRCERHRSLHEKACLPKEQRQLPPQPPFVINQPPLNNQSPFIHEDFLEQEALQGEPNCTEQEFTDRDSDIVLLPSNSNGPYAVKVFWEAERRDPEQYYWAPEIECRNAALLEKIQKYLAIVYEFVEESTLSQDRDMDEGRRKVQTQLDFLWTVGFSFCIPLRAED